MSKVYSPLDAERVEAELMSARGKQALLVGELRDVRDALYERTAERDAAIAELAALKKMLADAEWIRVHASMSNGIARYLIPPTNVSAPGRYALVRLEDGE